MDSLAEIKNKLLDKKTEIEERLKRINVHRKHENGSLDDDWEEQAVQRQNDDVLDSLDGTIRSEIRQINSALKKINDGNYGTCSQCGQKINSKRLLALPYSTRCISCAK